jgi:hypothetical protein
MAVTGAVWNFFDSPVEDLSTKSYEFREIQENGGSTLVSGKNRLRFDVKDTDQFILPSNGFLHLQVQLTKAAGGNLDANDPIAFESNLPLFSEASYTVGQKLIERVTSLNHVMHVQNMMDYSMDHSRSATSDFFYPNTGTTGGVISVPYLTTSSQVLTIAGGGPFAVTGTANGAITFSGTDVDAYNDGFKVRKLKTADSKVITVRVPLSRIFGFCRFNQKVTTGVVHTIELTRLDIDECIHTSVLVATEAYAINLSRASLWIPVLKPSLAQSISVEKMLLGGSQMIPFEFADIQKFAGLNNGSINLRIASATEKPVKVFIFFKQDVTVSTARRNYSPYKYDHLSLTRASLTVAGNKVPEYDFEANFGDGFNDYIRLYDSFLTCSDKSLTDYSTGSMVSYEDFKNLTPIVAFDLRNQDEKIFSKGSQSEIIFKGTVTAPTAQTAPLANSFTLFAMIVSERVLKLDVISGATHLSVE